MKSSYCERMGRAREGEVDGWDMPGNRLGGGSSPFWGGKLEILFSRSKRCGFRKVQNLRESGSVDAGQS
jgi:hypothetical protein